MTYVQKDWKDDPDHTTPLSAAAIEDLEVRITDYTDIHGPAVSVMDPTFGVVADGTTDDTAGFHLARDSAGVGGHVYVPPGTYAVAAVLLNVAGQRWELAPGAIIKAKAGAEPRAFSIRAAYVTIEGGEFDGNRTNVAGDGDGLIEIRVGNARVRNSRLHDAGGYGILAGPLAAATPLNDVSVENCSFIDTVAAAVFINHTGNTVPMYGSRIVNCYADNSAVAASTGSGFWIYGAVAGLSHGSLIQGCHVRTRADEVNLEALHIRYSVGARVVDCYLEGSGLGISCDNNQGLLVNNCHIYGPLSFGIETGGNTGVTISGCVIDGNAVTPDGIALTDTNSEIAITGNTIRNLEDSASAAAINFAGSGPHSRVSVVGNVLRSTNRGVELGTEPTDIVIADNLMAGDTPAYGVIADGVTTRTENWAIRNNTFVDCSSAGILFYSGAAKTLSNVDTRGNTYWNCGAHVTTTNVTLDGSCLAD